MSCRSLLYFSLSFLFFLSLAKPIEAVTLSASASVDLSANVPEQFSSPPMLLTPSDFAVTNNPHEVFSFIRASSGFGIKHYDLYLDGVIVAGNISDSALSQDNYFYTSMRLDSIIYVTLKPSLTEGYHQWRVVAAKGDNTEVSSGIRYFIVDTTIPIIILKQVEKNSLYWATNDPNTFPPAPRNLTVDTADPLFKGAYEAYANLKVALVCPSNTPNCVDQFIIINNDTGNWEHRFHDLLPGVKYTAYLAAVDAASNLNIFPEFFVTYVPKTISVTATPTLVSPTPSPSLISPTPTQTTPTPTTITPTPSLMTPPPIPTPPPPSAYQQATPKTNPLEPVKPYLPYLLVFGLVLHLLMTLVGASVPLLRWPSFIWQLLLPYFTSSRFETILAGKKILPFVKVSLVNAENPKDQQMVISNVLGLLNLPKEDSDKVLLRLDRPGYIFKDRLIYQKTLQSVNYFELKPKDHPSALERLQLSLTTTNWLPLLIADLTGLLAVTLTKELFFMVYTLVALNLTYTELIYPRLSGNK